jgi:outer membrane protein assembly factor BamB
VKITILRLAITAALWVNCSLRAGDWPEFRGPTGQGLSTARNVPIEWSDTTNVVWKQAVPGAGWSSPVLKAGRIYLTTAVNLDEENRRSLRALCLDAKDGHLVWDTEVLRQEIGGPGIHTKNSHASPTPIIEGDRLFVHFGHQGTACLDLSGKVHWQNKTLSYPPVHGSGGSPAIVGEMLVFSCDGGADPFVVALDKRTGEVRWKVNRTTDAAKTFSFSTPLLINIEGKKQIISPGSNVLCAYEPESGDEIWRVRYDGYSVIPRPVYGQGLLFIGTGYDRPTVMAIQPKGRGDLTETNVLWTLKRGAPNTPSLLLVDTELYMVSDAGIASCVDARSGEVHWQERIGGNYSASPISAEGRIYFQNEEGIGTVVKATRQFEKLAANPLNERTLASYAVDDGALYIRTAKHLFRIGEKKNSD